MQISAFVDGELPDSEADLLLRRMSQDPELRREAAEYLELGRVMRGESSLRGAGLLRERIAAALDDKAFDESVEEAGASQNRAIRPLLGVAVAASVALLAIFGLQLTPGIDSGTGIEDGVAEVADKPGYTVPQQVDDDLRQYLLSHGASSSELGANGMNARLVTLRLSEEALAEEAAEDDAEDDSGDDTATDETAADEPSTSR
jgi:negative regulator of sigma E activity